MNTFFVIANNQKDQPVVLAPRIKGYLEKKGRVCYVYEGELANAAQVPADVECVLVLGGDGTLLRAARKLVDRQVPLLGINMGTLGYLAEIEVSGVEDALDRLCEGRYTVENRMMLTGAVYREGRKLTDGVALNDIVTVRKGHMHVVDFKIYVNNAFLCSYRADGIILSTPTGSTGYSLSAGGPIVSPDANMIVMTTIAAHTLNARPVILPDDVTVTVEVSGRSKEDFGGAEVTFDGAQQQGLRQGDQIRIARASKQARLLKIRNTSFIEILRNKLN